MTEKTELMLKLFAAWHGTSVAEAAKLKPWNDPACWQEPRHRETVERWERVADLYLEGIGGLEHRVQELEDEAAALTPTMAEKITEKEREVAELKAKLSDLTARVDGFAKDLSEDPKKG